MIDHAKEERRAALVPPGIRDLRNQVERLTAELKQARLALAEERASHAAADKDAERMDWLADPEQFIGNVLLPSACVDANPDSLRGAIDMAMAMHAVAKEAQQ